MGFPKGFPFPTPEGLPDSWVEPVSAAWQVDSLPLNHQGSPPLALLLLLLLSRFSRI